MADEFSSVEVIFRTIGMLSVKVASVVDNPNTNLHDFLFASLSKDDILNWGNSKKKLC